MNLGLVEAESRGLPENYLGLLSREVIKMHYDSRTAAYCTAARVHFFPAVIAVQYYT